MTFSRAAFAACALLCAPMLTQAAADPSQELAEIRAQMQAVVQRLDRLEQENAALRQQNEALQANAAPQAQPASPAAAPAPARPKGTEWTERVALNGDIRYRHESTDDATQSDRRARDRIRARLAIDARVNDSIKAGVGLTTSEGGDPRAANQTLDNEFSRKDVYLDLAYFDWSFAQGAHAIGGKMKTPFFRPGQSLFFDNDVNPEGIAFTYAQGALFGSAYGFYIDENVATPPQSSSSADTMMYGLQTGSRFKLAGADAVVAAMYYDLAAAQGRRPFFSGNIYGNSTIGSGADAVLANDYRVLLIGGELSTTLASKPLRLWMDLARNLAVDEYDTAWTAGVMFGKASAPGSWEFGLQYEVLEKDALFAQHIDSDFGGGTTDSAGWGLRAGYAPLKNLSLNATYYSTRRNVDVGTESDHDRLLLDLNIKF